MSGALMLALSGNETLSPADREMLAHPAVGGVILFSRNYVDSAALRRLTADIRRCAQRPLSIAVDHEGGRVQRFRTDAFTHIPAMQKIAAQADAAELAHAAGVVLAAELLAHGIDITFAPVLDLDYGASQIIGDRAFSADAEEAARLAMQLACGLADAGMVCCGKHFPGHGFVAADSHQELPVDKRSMEVIQSTDLIPFARFAAMENALMMTAHIIYPLIDEHPATFSARWLKEILRDELGFSGLIVSDDLCMQGAVAVGTIEQRIRRAAQAGCDLFLLCDPQDNKKALLASSAIKTAGDWAGLKLEKSNRIIFGDPAYREARQRLSAIDA